MANMTKHDTMQGSIDERPRPACPREGTCGEIGAAADRLEGRSDGWDVRGEANGNRWVNPIGGQDGGGKTMTVAGIPG